MPTPIDTLITARWIIPVVPRDSVLEHHAIAVNHGVIVDVLPTTDAPVRYAASETLRLGEQVLIPGLINLHTHAAMTLMRSLADDLPLMRWLTDHIWPTEARVVGSDFVRDGTLLSCAEMLQIGRAHV